MTTEWVLIVAMLSPGGGFMGKDVRILPSKGACQQARVVVEQSRPLMGGSYKGVCVTKAHWEGKAHDAGVALD